MALKESFSLSKQRSTPLNLELPEGGNYVHIDQARSDQIALDEAHLTAMKTAELLRSGEIQPTEGTLRELAKNALYLVKSDLAAPRFTLDTLAVVAADLHAANAHKTGAGRKVLQQFDHMLEVVYPHRKTNPLEQAEAEALRQAIIHTTPDHPFEAAIDEDWEKITSDWIATPTNIPGHTTRTPSPPSKSPLDPAPWWNLPKRLSIKRMAHNNPGPKQNK